MDRLATLGLTFSVQDRHVIGGQSRLGLDADEQGRSPPRGDALAREVLALEAKSEGSLLEYFLYFFIVTVALSKIKLICLHSILIRYTCQLLDDLLDELAERIRGMLHPEMMDQLGDDFSIGVALEGVSSLLQQSLHLLVIRHDACENSK